MFLVKGELWSQAAIAGQWIEWQVSVFRRLQPDIPLAAPIQAKFVQPASRPITDVQWPGAAVLGGGPTMRNVLLRSGHYSAANSSPEFSSPRSVAKTPVVVAS